MILLAALLSACGNRDKFIIECQIEGIGDRGVELIYVDNGTVVRKMFYPREGKVKLVGASVDYTIAAVCPLDYGPMLECVVKNGDKLRVSANLDNPSALGIKGSKANEQYVEFLQANDSILNRGTTKEINALITKFVRENPSSLTSSLLMISKFRAFGNDMLADSLLRSLSPEVRSPNLTSSLAAQVSERIAAAKDDRVIGFSVRPAVIANKDSVVRFEPFRHRRSLLVFNSARKPDSLLRILKQLAKDSKAGGDLNITELSFAVDSTMWRHSIVTDTAKWAQGWVAGGPAAFSMRRLNIPVTPYYIIVDDEGHPVYQGPYLKPADAILRKELNINAEPLN